jgi:hypothetical protein
VALTALGGPAGPAVIAAGGGTTATSSAPSLRPVGFTVAVDPDDTVTVTFEPGPVDPTVLEKALADAGVPVRVWLSAECTGTAKLAKKVRWLDLALRFNQHGPDGRPTLTIRKSKLFAGVIVGLGISPNDDQAIRVYSMVLTTDSSLTCSTVPPVTASPRPTS